MGRGWSGSKGGAGLARMGVIHDVAKKFICDEISPNKQEYQHLVLAESSTQNYRSNSLTAVQMRL